MCVCVYIANCVSWVPKLTLLDLGTIGLTKALSEWSSFLCRELTVYEDYFHQEKTLFYLFFN